MSSVVRLKTGSAAQQASPLAGETAPEALPPPEPALLDWATLTPPADAHLRPCPQCGLPNGLSAAVCWSCETSLSPIGPSRRGPGPWLAAPAPAPADAAASTDKSIPVLTAAVDDKFPMTDLLMAALPVPGPPPRARASRYTRAIGATLLVVAGVAAFLYTEPAPPPDGTKGGGFVDAPGPAALTGARPTTTATAAPGSVGVVDPLPTEKAAQAQTAPQGLSLPAKPDAGAPPASKAPPAGKARAAPRTPNAATALSLPNAGRVDIAPPPPAPVAAKGCTATIAALGLCTAPSTETKE